MAFALPHTGAYSGAAQSGGFNHGHAASMAHAAAGRRAIASALGGVRPMAAAPVAAPGAPAMAPPAGMAPGGPPMAPPAPAMPPAAVGPAPAPEHIQKGNFKAHIAHQLSTHMGVHVTHNAVLSAIDRQAAGGGFTPFQAHALKTHKGPLEGPEGKQTMTKIAMEIVKPTQPVTK